ncbi:MAG: hypothetical protein JWN77_1163 [Frankiales bacterium]|jgi:hypothetical protein|nr:hypothetical protein [Frankiales bacterium]
MPSWTSIVTNNLKMAAVGTAAVLLTGTGAATTVSLVSDSTEVPETVVSTVAAAPTGSVLSGDDEAHEADDADEADDANEAEATESDTHTVGIRPTDTHGYCVSTAVHAAKAAGTSRSAAAHGCAKKDKPGKAEKAEKPGKAEKAEKPAKAKPAKAAKPGKAKPAKAAKAKPAKGHGKGKKHEK